MLLLFVLSLMVVVGGGVGVGGVAVTLLVVGPRLLKLKQPVHRTRSCRIHWSDS